VQMKYGLFGDKSRLLCTKMGLKMSYTRFISN
jgi:hypothetical protein